MTRSWQSSLSASVSSPTGCGLTGCNKFRQNQGPPVYNRSTAASTSNHCIDDQRRPGLSGYIRQESGHLHRFWSSDADARSTNSIKMLRCALWTALDPQLGAVIGGRSGAIQTWLRKQGADPIHRVRRLQSVQNAASRLICRLRCFDHITDELVTLHWLCVLERVIYKITVLTFKVMHGFLTEYLGPVVCVADLPCRQSLRSAGINRLVVPPFKLSTIGTQAFPVASPRVWNSLPANNTLAPSLSTFRQRL